jgi:hypothetical protein
MVGTAPDTRSELGLRTDKSFAVQDGVLTLRGRLAWAHDFNPDRSIATTFQALPGASFVVNGGGDVRGRVLECHPQLRRRALRLVSGRSRHALFAGQATTWPDITSRSRPLSLAA